MIKLKITTPHLHTQLCRVSCRVDEIRLRHAENTTVLYRWAYAYAVLLRAVSSVAVVIHSFEITSKSNKKSPRVTARWEVAWQQGGHTDIIFELNLVEAGS